MDERALCRAIDLIAASAWGTEAALRALERSDAETARSLLDDSRRPLLKGLRDLRAVLDGIAEPEDPSGVALTGVSRLHDVIARRSASA